MERQLISNIENRGYQELANAIIVAAVEDLREYLAILQKYEDIAPATAEENREYKKAITEAKEIIKFFRSPVFSVYTELDAEYLISKIREEVAA